MVGIVIKICALLQIFFPILEKRELLTQVLATKSMTIYYSEHAKSARQMAVCKCSFKFLVDLHSDKQYKF